MDIDIIQESSLDIEYKETKYKGTITNPAPDYNPVFTIPCIKIYEKTFKDLTYLKLELPYSLVLNTTNKVLIILTRKDYFQLRLITTIENNIVFFNTNEVSWSKFVNNKSKDLNYIMTGDTNEVYYSNSSNDLRAILERITNENRHL
jgi:hypothetical protein